MNIVRFEAKNVKRLNAVSITPSGNMVVIGGENGAGKSSVLDAIRYTLDSGNSLPEKPIFDGKYSGYSLVDLGDYVVTRKFKVKGDQKFTTELEIKNKEGFVVSSPQTLLESFRGKMTFDPLEFSRLKPKDQIEILRGLVGLNFSELDSERANAYEKRTEVNRDINKIKASISQYSVSADIPDEELSISALIEELNSAQKKNQENRALIESIEKIRSQRVANRETLAGLNEKLAALQEQIKKLESEQAELGKTYASKKVEISNIQNIDESSIKEKITNAESINSEVRKKKNHQELRKQYNELDSQSEKLTQIISEIDAKKNEMTANAPFPIAGLGFCDTGVTLNGLPFDQCSSAEKLKISVAMGIALNPKLKIMQIRDGSLLDENSLKIIDEMANTSGMQIWIEMVGERKECSVIISDGYLKSDERFV